MLPTRVSRGGRPVLFRPVATFYDPSSRQFRQQVPVTTARPRRPVPPRTPLSPNASFLDGVLPLAAISAVAFKRLG